MKPIPASSRAHRLARLCVFLMTAALIAGLVGCDGCNPPPSQNLEIRTWYELDAIRGNLTGSYILMNDLDSTTDGYEELASPTAAGGKGWEPIGFFSGTFDGQGYEIRELFISRGKEYGCVGLFGSVDTGGIIINIGVVNATVIGDSYVGGLVGENHGTVSNSYFTGSVAGYSNIGGLVGCNKDTVASSYSSANVTGELCVGGLVAFNNEGILSNSYFIGRVTGNLGVGGLVAFNYESIVSNSHYDYDEVLINDENIITIGALFGRDFDQWLANDKFLDINDRLSQENGYYVVNNLTDFKELLAFGQHSLLKFGLKSDLDLGDESNFYIPYLAGEFDGNGHKISNLSFNFYFVSHIGLFGYLAPGGRITQVRVETVNIVGASSVGGLVGVNWEGNVSDCYSTGTVIGSATTSTISYEESVGGLVGANWEGTVSDCYSTGSISGKEEVGGVVGDNYQGFVSNSYFNGNVTGHECVGGLVGWNKVGIVGRCYSTGTVNGYRSVGGLAGQNYGTVRNSYTTASVNGHTSVGGLVGCNNHGTASSSYSTGSVAGVEQVGGLVGWNEMFGTVNNSFWDMETSGQSTSDGGTGKTTAEMKDIAIFSGAGWDITTVADPGECNPAYIWNVVDDVTYPFLSWQS